MSRNTNYQQAVSGESSCSSIADGQQHYLDQPKDTQHQQADKGLAHTPSAASHNSEIPPTATLFAISSCFLVGHTILIWESQSVDILLLAVLLALPILIATASLGYVVLVTLINSTQAWPDSPSTIFEQEMQPMPLAVWADESPKVDPHYELLLDPDSGSPSPSTARADAHYEFLLGSGSASPSPLIPRASDEAGSDEEADFEKMKLVGTRRIALLRRKISLLKKRATTL